MMRSKTKGKRKVSKRRTQGRNRSKSICVASKGKTRGKRKGSKRQIQRRLTYRGGSQNRRKPSPPDTRTHKHIVGTDGKVVGIKKGNVLNIKNQFNKNDNVSKIQTHMGGTGLLNKAYKQVKKPYKNYVTNKKREKKRIEELDTEKDRINKLLNSDKEVNFSKITQGSLATAHREEAEGIRKRKREAEEEDKERREEKGEDHRDNKNEFITLAIEKKRRLNTGENDEILLLKAEIDYLTKLKIYNITEDEEQELNQKKQQLKEMLEIERDLKFGLDNVQKDVRYSTATHGDI